MATESTQHTVWPDVRGVHIISTRAGDPATLSAVLMQTGFRSTGNQDMGAQLACDPRHHSVAGSCYGEGMMTWKISLSTSADPEALHVLQRMVYAAAKTQGASEHDARAVETAVREAFLTTHSTDDNSTQPIQIDLECNGKALVLLVGADQQWRSKSMPAILVEH